MKKTLPFSAILLGTAILLCISNSCSKSSDNSSSSNNPPSGSSSTAQAAYDNQSGGIYKGTLTGSSGYFYVNLQVAKPYVIYQWTDPSSASDSLSTSALSNWQSGQAISKALFTGSSGAKFWFSVGANGSNPTVDSIYLPSHTGPVYAVIVKEVSNGIIKIYQGTASPVSSNGGNCVSAIINIWTGAGMAAGTFLAASGEHGGGFGTITGNQLQISLGNTSGNVTTESGTLTINSDASAISGTVSGNSCSHTISLKRIF